MKKFAGDIIILQICTKNDNHMMQCCWDTEHNRKIFFVILDHFLPFYPLATLKIKILKNWKKTWRYYHFTHVHHKWQSSDIWFLRYWVQWTDFLVILDCFLPFYPSKNPKNQNFENLKKRPEILSLYTCAP